MAYDSAREWLGHEPAADYWRLTEAYVDRMGELGGDAFRRTGSLRLAGDDERDELLRRVRGAARGRLRRGVAGRAARARWRDASRAPCSIPPTRCCSRRGSCGGWRPPPPRRGWRSASTRAWPSWTSSRRTTVVVATDGYPSGLLGELEGLIIPTRGQMLATEPLPERLFPLPHYGRHGLDYWHQNEEGRLLVGGFRDVDMDSEFTATEATTERIQSALENFVEQLLGRRPEITHRWAGVFGLVPDLMPVVGPVPGRDGLWVAGGYSGHGNVLGLMCGDLVAQAIAASRIRCSRRWRPHVSSPRRVWRNIGCAGARCSPRCASSVAPIAVAIGAPCVLPRNEHRTPATSDIPPNPPRARAAAGRARPRARTLQSRSRDPGSRARSSRRS